LRCYKESLKLLLKEVMFLLDALSDSKMTLNQESRGDRKKLINQSMEFTITSSTEEDVARTNIVGKTLV
jgi:hypothetical protein